MTGQVFTATPPHRVSVAYSIDSFADYSTAAVSRTPTRAIVPPSASISFNTCMDEELFRDLFADADTDAEQRDAVFGVGVGSPAKKGKTSAVPNHSMVWHTGATLTKPFASPLPQRQLGNQAAPLPSVAPSLSVPPPRQNAIDLITPRPQVTARDEETASTQLGLARVPEVNEEDEDDEQTAALPTKSKSSRRVLAPVGPLFSFKKPEPVASIHNETLQFLEKLDLKALLAQPRPDVTSFLPPSNQPNQATRDPRTEDYDRSSRPSAQVPIRKPLSSRKEPLHPLPEGTTRLAHMAQTYGTTANGPRKARKETLERLSNPITGHTSTLQALTPEARQKREAELVSWPPTDKSVTPVKTLTSRKTRDLIERLTESHGATPTNAVSHRGGGKKIIKGKKPTKITVRPSSLNNQDETEPTNKPTGARQRHATLSERKTMLKEKLAGRSVVQQERPTMSGSTFLTQHEDSEAKMASTPTNPRRSNRKLVPQRPKDTKATHDLLHLPQRPVVPPSVRLRVSSSTSPSKASKSVPHAMRATASSTVKGARTARGTASPRDLGNNKPHSDRKRTAPSKKSGAVSASSSLLGTSARERSMAPLGSSGKSRSRSQASVTKPKPFFDPASESLPFIRRPAPAPPQRPAAPATRRTHRIRSTS